MELAYGIILKNNQRKGDKINHIRLNEVSDLKNIEEFIFFDNFASVLNNCSFIEVYTYTHRHDLRGQFKEVLNNLILDTSNFIISGFNAVLTWSKDWEDINNFLNLEGVEVVTCGGACRGCNPCKENPSINGTPQKVILIEPHGKYKHLIKEEVVKKAILKHSDTRYIKF